MPLMLLDRLGPESFLAFETGERVRLVVAVIIVVVVGGVFGLKLVAGGRESLPEDIDVAAWVACPAGFIDVRDRDCGLAGGFARVEDIILH
jgi:hypothetical protein